MPEEIVPFVGQALRTLREEVGNASTVLGFVGAPYTLATYIVEGGSSKSFTHTKRLAFSQPEVLHALLGKLADSIADYVRYQVRYQGGLGGCEASRGSSQPCSPRCVHAPPGRLAHSIADCVGYQARGWRANVYMRFELFLGATFLAC